jgi:Protein of unknown function (DUF4230)
MSGSRYSLAYAAVGVVAIIAAGFVFLVWSCQRTALEFASRAQSAFAEALKVQPQVRIDQHVVLGQISPIAELALVTQEELVDLKQADKLAILGFDLPMTEREASLSAVFRVKAGYDLNEVFQIDMDHSGRIMSIDLPPPRILSLEMVKPMGWKESDGWFNRITDEDRARLLGQLREVARSAMDQSDILERVREEARRRLESVLAGDRQPQPLPLREPLPR